MDEIGSSGLEGKTRDNTEKSRMVGKSAHG